MSRKWERMVLKNQKTVNRARKKQGVASVEDTVRSRGAETVIKGRGWMFPSLLVLFSLMYFVTTFSAVEVVKDSLYWITGLSYIALAGLMYLIRRPVVRVAQQHIVLRRFTGDKLIEAKEIEELTLNNGHIIILLKNKKKYMYSRLQHRFPMDTLNSKLRDFAVSHKLTLNDETK